MEDNGFRQLDGIVFGILLVDADGDLFDIGQELAIVKQLDHLPFNIRGLMWK